MPHIDKYVDSKIPEGMSDANSLTFNGVDTNLLGACTDWIDVSTCHSLAFYVENKTGDTTVCKVGLEMSPDGNFNGGYHMVDGSMALITGEGHMHFHDIDSMSFVRLCVQTVQGGLSTSDFYMQAFRSNDD